MVDESGNRALPVPAGPLAERERLDEMSTSMLWRLIYYPLSFLLLGVVYYLLIPLEYARFIAIALFPAWFGVALWLGKRPRGGRAIASTDRRLLNRMKRLPLRSIDSIDEGTCRIRGRVSVLRPTLGDYGAYRRIHRERALGLTDIGLLRTITNDRIYEELRHSCGRLAILDDSGVAIVDDDALRIVGAKGETVALIEGSEVEVAGRAKRSSSIDDRHGLPAGYREGESVLVFDGDANQPVVVRAIAGSVAVDDGLLKKIEHETGGYRLERQSI